MNQPLWLENFQQQFSAVIRRPLEIETGQLRVRELLKDQVEDLGAHSHQGLLAYNRLYWYRLLTVMQNEYPLTSQVMGLWAFNRLVQAYLYENPPQSADVQKIAELFVPFLEQISPRLTQSLKISQPAQLLMESARIDRAFQESFLAEGYQAWSLRSTQAEALAELQLLPAPAWRIVAEHWNLMDSRSRMKLQPKVEPQALQHTQRWLIFRREQQVGQCLLHPLQALLYEWLRQWPLGEALAHLQQQCSSEELTVLANSTQQWMAQSVNLGLWMNP